MDIHLHLGDGVNKEESKIAICSLSEIVDFLPKTLDDRFNIRVFDDSLERYETSSFVPEIEKFDGSNILWNFILERKNHSHSHFDVAIFSKRITVKDRDRNWLDSIFGLAGSGVAIVSTHGFNHGLKNRELRNLCLRRAILHEFFHIIGLVPNWRETNVDTRLGLNCSNICIMRQGMSVSEWKKYSIEEEKKGVILCSQCKENLFEVLSRK